MTSCLKLQRILFSKSVDVYSDLSIEFALRNYPKMTPHAWIHSLNQKLQRILFSKSADVYSDLSIEFALRNYPKMTPHMLKSSYTWFHPLKSADVYSDLNLPRKITLKWLLICLNAPTKSKVTEDFFFKSADLYSDITIIFASKNYSKMTPHMLKSVHLIKSYRGFFFQVSWFVQWPHHYIGLKKLPQNDTSYTWFHPLNQKLQTVKLCQVRFL